MSDDELDGLGALSSSFNWTLGREDVWVPSPYHVEDLHPEAATMIRQGVASASASKGANPLGVVLVGQQGAGKTHLIGWAREQVQQVAGYFFLVGDLSSKTFWEETRAAILEQLLREIDGRSQLVRLLGDLARRANLSEQVQDAVTGRVPPTKDHLNEFAAALHEIDKSVIVPGQDVARALVLLASPRHSDNEVGYSFLAEYDLDREERRALGIRSTRMDVKFLITELSRILAMSGPTVIAVDQIDALIDKVTRAAELGGTNQDHQIAEVARDLMELHGRTRRTLTIIACLGESWEHVMRSGLATVKDRFFPAWQLQNIPTPEAGRQLVAKRFAVAFTGIGFKAPYPTWPIRSTAFQDAPAYTARTLLQRVEKHISRCRRSGLVRELNRLDDDPNTDDKAPEPKPEVDQQTIERLDAEFDELRASADIGAAFDAAREDAEMPALLAAGLDAWVHELDDGGRGFHKDPRRADFALHACLRMVSEGRLEQQRRWAFRAIAAENPNAVQSRIKRRSPPLGSTARVPSGSSFFCATPSGPRARAPSR